MTIQTQTEKQKRLMAIKQQRLMAIQDHVKSLKRRAAERKGKPGYQALLLRLQLAQLELLRQELEHE